MDNLTYRFAKWLAIAVSALVAIAAIGELVGNHVKAARGEPIGGIVSMECPTENTIMQAAAAAERGNVPRLRKLHDETGCKAVQRPVAARVFENDNMTLQLKTTNAGDGIIAVYKVELKQGTTWVLCLMNPDFFEEGEGTST